MKNLIEYVLEDGSILIIESDVKPTSKGPVRAGKQEAVAERAAQTFETALLTALPATNTVINKLRNTDIEPNKVELAFGIKFSAGAGAVVASAGAEANFSIKMTWEK